jgi:L-ascorbate metabolism protein UlaG (beta-lactamase superfamily)
VAGPTGHIVDFLRYLARRGARHTEDARVATELAWASRPDSGLPPGLELEWLGTSGFRFRYQGATLLVDPYLSRIPLADVLRRRPVQASEATVRRYVDGADAILVGHTHFDHAIDAPLLAELFSAPAFGSYSLRRLMELHGLGARAVEVEPFRVYEVGPFRFSFVPSLHSKLMLGRSVPFDGDISCEHFDELTPSAYGCGQVWGIHLEVAGVRFYHQGSADLDDAALADVRRHRGVDYFLCGIAGRRFTDRYLERMVRHLEPAVIVPHHYDDFFRPLSAPPGFSLNVDLAGFAGEVGAVSRALAVRTLAPLRPISG